MYSGPGINWNHAWVIVKILTTDIKAFVRKYNFSFKMMARIEMFKCIGAGDNLTILVSIELQRMYLFSLVLMFYILLRWTIFCGENKFCFEVLSIIFPLGDNFFQVIRYSGGILSRRYFFQYPIEYIYLH